MKLYQANRSRGDEKPRRLRVGVDLERIQIPANRLLQTTSAYPKPEMPDRQGVWVHTFLCNLCGLHFNVYSWLPDRHKVATVTCPECGQHEGKFRHFLLQTSEAAGEEQGWLAVLNAQPGEIFMQCPPAGAAPMSDFTSRGMKPLPSRPKPKPGDAG